MDGDGAINLSVIGPYDSPKVRLPGGAGAPEVVQNYRKVVAYFSKHDARTLVAKVDFATGRRTPISRAARDAEGLATGGPVTIVTPLAVLVKADDDEPFAIESVHPGVSVDDVVANTGFELRVPGEVPTTAEPRDDQVALLRDTIDPLGTVRFDFLSGEERLEYLEEVLDREWQQAAALVGQKLPGF
jgi:acyl CoA:acetate/3-ketoacid CoA transferase beta subunit